MRHVARIEASQPCLVKMRGRRGGGRRTDCVGGQNKELELLLMSPSTTPPQPTPPLLHLSWEGFIQSYASATQAESFNLEKIKSTIHIYHIFLRGEEGRSITILFEKYFLHSKSKSLFELISQFIKQHKGVMFTNTVFIFNIS